MGRLTTKKLSIHNAEQFVESVSEPANTAYYSYIGRVHPWDDDNNPPTPLDTVQETEFAQYRDMIGVKKVAVADVSHSIPRHDWVTSTTYAQWEDANVSLYDSNFYVLTDTLHVYKCLYNNSGVVSTIKPTGVSTSKFATADGYIWKFMFNITSAESAKFVTPGFIPVQRIGTDDDGSAQWDVEQAASDGALEIIDVITGGSNYRTHHIGTVSGVTNSSVMDLGSGANTVLDDYYNLSGFYLSGGLGAGQVRQIVDYVASTRRITVNPGFSVTPNTETTYSTAPFVSINGDGTGAVAISTINAGANSIANVTVVNTGINYTRATINIIANTTFGSGAVTQALIGPKGGHGNNAIRELGGDKAILNVEYDGTESNNIAVGVSFRKIGLMRNPIFANGTVANTSSPSVVKVTTDMVIKNRTGTFAQNEILDGVSSGAIGRIVTANTTALVLTNTEGVFTVNEQINGNTSLAFAFVDSVTVSELTKNSGDVMYVENISPVARTTNQKENIKMIIEF